MTDNRKKLRRVAQGAVIGALYVALTVAFAPISFGAVQLRVAEALTIMPMFARSAVSGLFVGCLLANMLGGAIPLDIIFGSLATLIGAAGGWLLRKHRWLVPIPTIIANTVIVPLVLKYGYGETLPIPVLMLSVAAGEILGCYVLGELLAQLLIRHRQVFDDEQ